jgi:hypothetical protein
MRRDAPRDILDKKMRCKNGEILHDDWRAKNASAEFGSLEREMAWRVYVNHRATCSICTSADPTTRPLKMAQVKEPLPVKRYTRQELLAQWDFLMKQRDYGNALQFAQLHLLRDQADIARKAWAEEVLRGQA